MKKTIIDNLLCLGLLCIVTNSFAQNYDNRCFIAQINEEATQPQIDSLLGLYNLYIADGPTTAFNNQFALVCIDTVLGIPDSIDFGNNEEGDINALIISTATTDDSNDNIFDATGLNYDISQLPTPSLNPSFFYHHPLAKCGISTFSINTTFGSNDIKVGLLDTGIKLRPNSELNAFFDLNDLGVNTIDNTSLPIDDNGHGTHMASTIALATPNNLSSVVQMQAYKTHDAAGFATVWRLIKGIDEAILDEVQIISMSNSYREIYEHRFSEAPLYVAIKEASDIAGILFITAAGNNGVDNDDPNELSSYPASFLANNILAVTAVDCKYDIPIWANTGATSVDIAAPGLDIWGLDHNNQFVQLSGTSSATAFTSRVAAMLATQQTVFDYEEIKCAIINGTNQALNIPIQTVSNGYLDAAMAQAIFDTGAACAAIAISLSTPASDENSLEAAIQYGEVLTINSTMEQMANLRVFNTLGQMIYLKEVHLQQGQNNYALEIPSLNTPFAAYVCHIQYGEQNKTIKFVK